MDVRLVVLSASRERGMSIRIPRFPFVIGRAPPCQILPRSLLVSRLHCALVQCDGSLFVEDLGSCNGTFVNDRRTAGRMPVLHGDRLKVGPVTFEIRLHADKPLGDVCLGPPAGDH